MASGRNLIARVSFGDLKVELIAEGASWNPDIADDLMKRVKALYRDSVETMIETNAWGVDDDDDDD